MNYLLDTTAYSHLLRGHNGVAKAIKKADGISLPNVVVAELRYGFKLGNRYEDNERLLARFVANKKVRILLPDNATTDYFVNIAVFAQRKGVHLSTHDIWIAALSEQWDTTLISFDKDFMHLDYSGLKLQFENEA